MISEVLQWIVQRVSLTEIVFFPVSRVSAFQIMVGFLVWREVLTKFARWILRGLFWRCLLAVSDCEWFLPSSKFFSCLPCLE